MAVCYAMNLYYTFSIVIVLAAIIAYLNQRFLKMPNTIGVMFIALSISVILMLFSNLFPAFFRDVKNLIDSVDFSKTVMGAVLNFLLFAGTIQIRIKDLKKNGLSVLLFSTLSVVISTVLVGYGAYALLTLLSMKVSLLHCMLFGALISPTDPVAVLGIVKEANLSKSMETKIAGESLFNDGIALVIFFTILNAIRNPDDAITFHDVTMVFVHEALGGLGLGIALGFIGTQALRTIDNYKVEVMITLAIVMGGYTLARALGISGPLTMVAAGIYIGNYGKTLAMSDITKDYVDKFWELIEEILNIVLFVLIGFELLLIKNFNHYWLIGLLSIPMVLAARFISIAGPSMLARLREKMSMDSILFLTWSGLRGGISIALALSFSRSMHRDLFVFMTYCVVIFSVIVQGLTLQKIANRKQERPQYEEQVPETQLPPEQ